MKKLFITLCFVLAVLSSQAQSYNRNRFLVEGDYTRTGKFDLASAISYDFRNDRGHSFSFGVRYASQRTAMNIGYQIALLDGWSDNSLFYLENRYLYRRFKAYGLQEFNAMLSFGYRNIHWDFKLGLCNRYIAEVPLRKNGGEGVIFEPMNVAFSIEYNLFAQDHPWNIGCGISNYREFIIERVTLFYYTLHSYYDIDEHWRLLGEAGLHPSGVLNLSAQYNGFFVNLGFIYNY